MDSCSACSQTRKEIDAWAAASDEPRREMMKRASERIVVTEADLPLEATEGMPAAGTSDGAGTPHSAPLEPTDRWWARRWIDKATTGEIAAMRALLLGEGPSS